MAADEHAAIRQLQVMPSTNLNIPPRTTKTTHDKQISRALQNGCETKTCKGRQKISRALQNGCKTQMCKGRQHKKPARLKTQGRIRAKLTFRVPQK